MEGLQTVFPFVSVPRDQYRVLIYTIDDITQLIDISVSLDSSHVVVRHNHTSCPFILFLMSKMKIFRSAGNQKLRVEGPSGRSPSSQGGVAADCSDYSTVHEAEMWVSKVRDQVLMNQVPEPKP